MSTPPTHDADNGTPPTASYVADLEARLREAEETLDAIRNGEVDAVVVGGPNGQQVYTLENADRPYRVLIEQMLEGAVTLSEDGTILYCNERFATLVGADREGVLGGPFGRFVAPGDHAGFHRLLSRGPGAAATGEFKLRRSDRTAVPVNISLVDLVLDEGAARIVCGIVTDLTNNYRRSDELAAANQRLEREIAERGRAELSLGLALDAAGMGGWDLDLATGMIRRSLRHDVIFGHTGRVPGWTLRDSMDRLVPDDRDRVERAFAEAVKTGWLEFEARIRRVGDDAVRRVHVKAQTYYDAGQPVRIAGVVADVTDQRVVEEQLRQAQKMEAVGKLTGGIAHDFNNLLMIIGGSLDMLGRRVPRDPKTDFLIESAQQGIQRGAKLNQQLLAFSRRQDLHAEVVCIDRFVETFDHLLDRAVGETIPVKIVRASNDWRSRIDHHQLETAILNLAINARDAMPGGGVLTLTTESRSVDHDVAARWGAIAGDFIVVSIADTGIGMPPAVAERAFEPFFTTKGIGKGTGLGLSQVYGFAKQSRGFVTIDSEPEAGTKVSIFLPRTEEALPAAATTEPERPAAVTGSGLILVVEDDADVRRVTAGMLHDLGFLVREAANAREALALIDSGTEVDLVFSDVIMPGGQSGIELAQELNASRPHLPVLLASGYTAEEIIPEALFDELVLLHKPYSQTELSRAIIDTTLKRSGRSP
ncbi:MAG TPA: ATP-binding protein [Aliidongia sp.]|uniref:hybrid sensor histidine kinase/response regulator n=1 Tax=Aliidongia sp. TaxID=1914230 RepID=UPI002DDDA4BB|nr:ATP-binding protein [Aliidongia sp.]HEV2677518.1 ATP-binding protein [Aliidongia sp.]